MVAADNDDITGPESLDGQPRRQGLLGHRLDPVGEHPASTSPATTSWCCSTSTRSAPTRSSNGQVDAVTTDNVILLGFVAESDGEFKLVGEQFTEEPYGIGITKGDVEFCEFINETLQENEDAYIEAWEATAGEVEGTETPELPEPDECV